MGAEKDIYALGLHESVTIANTHKVYTITRVPGGWLYESTGGVAFVPYHDEYCSNPD